MRNEYWVPIIIGIAFVIAIVWTSLYFLNKPPTSSPDILPPSSISGEVSSAAVNHLVVETDNSENITVWYPSVIIDGEIQGPYYSLSKLVGKRVAIILWAHLKGGMEVGTVFSHSG